MTPIPAAAAAYENALSLWRSGQRGEALQALRMACDLAPQEVIYQANLSAALVDECHWQEAEAASRRALAIAPDRAESWHGLGNALTGQQRWLEAANAYETAASLKPDLPRCDEVAAQAWLKASQPENALRRYVRAAAGMQGREDPELLTAMAGTLTQLSHVDQPLELYRQVAQLLPGNAAAQNNLGLAYQGMARHDEASECYRRALSIDPSQAATWSNLMNCLNYSPKHGPGDVLEAARQFEHKVARPLRDARPYLNEASCERALRVGYVSPDLRRHPVAHFALPLLEGHTDQVEVVCYYNHRQVDDWTERFRKASHLWVDCEGWSDETLAGRIRADHIDILVDLAGHTENNRLLTFARKPAPVQATWLGYVTTTGLSAMDWRMTYEQTDPEGTDADYSEQLWRLGGGMWGYRPPEGMPQVAPPPEARKGHITFGHFNRFSKVSQPALNCWAEILTQVAGSRLVIGLPPGNTRRQIAQFFETRGVAANRIDVYDKLAPTQFWAAHGEVDIALDPFPFNGGTTSYETLWLGVPIVTCTGGEGSFAPRFASRMGQALLHTLGVPDLVASTEAEYVRLAVNLARNPARLATLRGELRKRMAASALLNEALQVRNVEAAYRSMWKAWCGRPRSG